MGSVHGKCIDESDNDSGEISEVEGWGVELTSSTSIFQLSSLSYLFQPTSLYY